MKKNRTLPLCVDAYGIEVYLPTSFFKSSDSPRNVHNHPCFELICIEGGPTMRFKLIPPVVDHLSADAPPENVRSLLFSLKDVEKNDVCNIFAKLDAPVDVVDSFGGKDALLSIRSAINGGKIGCDELIAAELRLLFVKLARAIYSDGASSKERAQTLDDERLALLDSYFNENLNDSNAGKKDLASKLGVTERHLSRILLGAYGCNFAAVLLKSRMSMAQALMSQGEKTLDQIAGEVGYSSLRSFKKAYTRYYGKPLSNKSFKK